MTAQSTARPVRIAAFLAILASLTLAPVMANARVRPDVRVIKLGGVFAMTGDPSAISLPILAGYKLAFTQVNAGGGVNGAKISYTTLDDGYDPSRTLPAVKQLVESDGVRAISGIFGSDDSNAAVSYLKEKKEPFFDPIGGGANVAGDSWIWQTEPSYGLEGTIMGHYISKTLKLTKVAVVYQQGINEPEVKSLRHWFKTSNLLAVSYRATDTDAQIGPKVFEVRAFKPQLVILLGTLVPTADFVKDAAANLYQPPKGWFANYPQGDQNWLGLAGACNCLKNSHVTSYADLTGHNKVAHAYSAAIKKYDPSQKYSNYGLYGYFNGTLIIRALKSAGKSVTAASLQKALNTKFRNYQSGFTGTLNWTPKYHYGVKQFKVYKISGSKFIPVTNWLSK